MNISLRTGFLCLFVCGGLLSLYGLWPTVSVNTSTEVQVDCGPTKTEVIKSIETVYIQTPAVLEPIVLTLVMLGPDIGHEGSIAIKSALMHTSRPLNFHLICTPENIEYMEGKFALFDRPVYPVEVTYYPITPEQVQDRVHRAGIGGNWNLLSKVFIHELLVDIDRAIFIDTDMIFVVDPLELWKNFADFGEDQLMSFPTMGPQSHAGKICSCVMLMDLARMRDVQFMPSTLLPAREALASSAFARGQSEGLQVLCTKVK
ncbi:hypothetical protein CPB85DRAFT_1248198 [Mucidula mucida]|nr:hypothetical protein CPB85DRAFT_1248198 [Mucidula mucida]